MKAIDIIIDLNLTVCTYLSYNIISSIYCSITKIKLEHKTFPPVLYPYFK